MKGVVQSPGFNIGLNICVLFDPAQRDDFQRSFGWKVSSESKIGGRHQSCYVRINGFEDS